MRLVVVGASGRMGRMLVQAVAAAEDRPRKAGIDSSTSVTPVTVIWMPTQSSRKAASRPSTGSAGPGL
jgi:dihydrodipicolinate reductase